MCDIKSFHRGFQFGDVRLGRADFCVAGGADELRNNRRGKDPDDHHHHHDFDQCETPCADFFAFEFSYLFSS